jgi:ADP-heptose:LPS heptosyltransferase
MYYPVTLAVTTKVTTNEHNWNCKNTVFFPKGLDDPIWYVYSLFVAQKSRKKGETKWKASKIMFLHFTLSFPQKETASTHERKYTGDRKRMQKLCVYILIDTNGY